MPTMIRTETNGFAPDQELAFAIRRPLTDDMRRGCREAIRAQMGDDPMLVNLGFGEPVSVSQNNYIEGMVGEAVCLIVYSDEQYDSMFFVYRSRLDDGLYAVMGSSYDISRCIDGYLDDDRYVELSWDAEAKTRKQVFEIPDMKTLFADEGVGGTVSGAVLEGSLLSIGKMDTEELDIDRVPEITAQTTEVIAQASRLVELTMPRELFIAVAG